MPVGIALANKDKGLNEAAKPADVSADKGQKRIRRTSDLPLPQDHANAETIWTTVIVPRFISYVGSLANPWDADSLKNEDEVLRQLWEEAFDGLVLESDEDLRKVRDIVRKSFRFGYPLLFKPRADPLLDRDILKAGQRVYDWRSGIGKAAVKAVEGFLDDQGYHSPDQRKAYYADSCVGKIPKCLLSNPEVCNILTRATVTLTEYA